MMAANYRHIGGLENRLGRHYSRFSASWPAVPLPLNHLRGENRQTMGRIGEVRLACQPLGGTGANGKEHAMSETVKNTVTVVGIDYGYDRVLERQILGLVCPGDVLIAISTSGRSPNILRAISAGREKSLAIVGFTGRTGGEMASRCELCLHAPSDSTQLIQQIHITAGHIICGRVEEHLFPRASA
jgi:hypothetical protein